MLKKWDKPIPEPGAGPKRIGANPNDVPRDGEWYVMRSETCGADSSRHDRKVVSLRIGAATHYLRTRIENGRYDGFEVAKVREVDADTGAITWHMLGRWS